MLVATNQFYNEIVRDFDKTLQEFNIYRVNFESAAPNIDACVRENLRNNKAHFRSSPITDANVYEMMCTSEPEVKDIYNRHLAAYQREMRKVRTKTTASTRAIDFETAIGKFFVRIAHDVLGFILDQRRLYEDYFTSSQLSQDQQD